MAIYGTSTYGSSTYGDPGAGLALADAAATATAAAPADALSLPLLVPDVTALATAAAAAEALAITGLLGLIDVPAVATTAAAGEKVTRFPDGWVADLTGRALLGVTTSTTGLYVPPPAATPPADVTPVAITSYCQVIEPADATHPVRALVEPVETVVGVPHVWVDGVDRTWTADGELCRIDNLTSEAGYGDRTARLTVHGMEIWNKATGDPAFAWLHRGARVEAGVVAPDGTRHVWWSGDLASTSGSSRGKDFARTYDCTGPALAMARAKHQPLDTLDPTDVGVIWAQIRNGVNSAPYAKVKPVRTGITTRKRGAFGQSEAEYERDILATAWSGARPWRPVKSATTPRLYELRLIDTTAVHWTVTAGAHGVDVDVDEDWTANPNRIFGRGRLNNGYWWSNSKFPGFLPYAPPPYPFNDPDRQLFVGTTDADTDTGNGVSVFQRRLQELGYAIAVDGVVNTSDTAIVRKVQADLGLQVDGIAAGQTWTGVWAVGAAAADLSRVRRPLASDPRVEPWLYQANGAIAGPNPDYDPAWPCVEEDIEYGENTSLELGIRDAQERITRFALTTPRTGRITLRTDPRQGSRFLIDECDNILVLGWEGEDVLFHIADIERDLAGGTVTLTVDSAFRDALTVKQIRDRNSESAPDPARKPGAIGRTRGTTTPDVATPFDGQSVAGKLPPLTIFGGLWSVWPIPFCKVGALARVYAETHDPTEFALLFFGQEVVPAQLQHGIGNPLAASRPWSDEQVNAWLTAHGFIDGWGHQDQPAGYGSGSKSDGDPLLGWLLSSSAVPFFAPQAVIWAAVISTAPCEISIDVAPQAGE